MNMKAIRRVLCAVLAIAVLASCAFGVLAEESGNPFLEPGQAGYEDNAADPEASVEDPFAVQDTAVPAATSAPAAQTPITGAGTAVDLFNLGTPTPGPAIGSNPGADPFGTGGSTSIPGYNPFDPSASVAPVAAGTVMYVTAATARIRRSANDRAKILMTVSFGQELTVTATQGEWARVSNAKGQTGYCRLSELSEINPNTMSKMMYAQLKRVPVYRTPNRRAAKTRWLNLGDTVTMVAISSDGLWARVSDGGGYGFVPTIYLDDVPASQGTPAWCVDGATAVLVNPDNWIEIGKLSLGQEVRLAGYVNNNTVAKIRSTQGYVAYCAASALSTAQPAEMNTPVYAQVSGRILYRSASEDAKAVGIGKNARLTLVAVDNSQYWALVKYNGRKYYTPYVCVGASRLGNAGKVVVTTEDTPLYRSNTETIATLPVGTRLTLNGVSGTAGAVTTIGDGVTPQNSGYVMLQYLRAE